MGNFIFIVSCKKCNFFFIFVKIEPNFQIMQDQFMEKNYRHFDDNEENKLIYTTVHKEYVNKFNFFLSCLFLVI
jgi:hypothetical protein